MAHRICVMTTGHLSTCPRMLKAADAFAEAGHDVHVVMIRAGGWAAEADARLFATRSWRAHVVSYDREESPVRWMWSGVRQRVARAAIDTVPAAQQLASMTRALSRVAPEIVDEARAIHADFYYGGAAGAIGLPALAARGIARWGVDFEDAHGLEPLEQGDGEQAERMTALERRAVEGAALITAAGDGVAAYYRERHGVRPLVVNNVFLVGAPPPIERSGPLRIYWFSQTIGPRRGLDQLIEALGRADVSVMLTLRGRADEPYVRTLVALAASIARRVDVRIEPPADPDAMVAAAAAHDVGVSFEDASIPHRAVCTPNKLFVYLAAGLAVAASPTAGQAPVLRAAPNAWVPLESGNTTAFETAIREWSDSPGLLHQARAAAWEAASRRWRWDYPCERDALVTSVADILQ